MSRRPKTDIEEELKTISYKMKALEDQNERLGKALEIALETFEQLWLEKPKVSLKKAIKRMTKYLI